MAVSGKCSVGATIGQEYTFGKKLGAFGRGVVRLKPFLNIAEEGLQRYSLTPKQEEKYYERIRHSFDYDARLPQLFGPKMPRERQKNIAERLVLRINFRPLQAQDTKLAGCARLANEMAFSIFILRKEIADALYEGRVTSSKAQMTLAGCFVRQPVEICNRGWKRQIKRVISPGSRATEEFKERVRVLSGGQEGHVPEPAA